MFISLIIYFATPEIDPIILEGMKNKSHYITEILSSIIAYLGLAIIVGLIYISIMIIYVETSVLEKPEF